MHTLPDCVQCYLKLVADLNISVHCVFSILLYALCTVLSYNYKKPLPFHSAVHRGTGVHCSIINLLENWIHNPPPFTVLQYICLYFSVWTQTNSYLYSNMVYSSTEVQLRPNMSIHLEGQTFKLKLHTFHFTIHFSVKSLRVSTLFL